MFQFYYEIPISSGFISSSRLPFVLTLNLIFFLNEKNDQHIVKDSQLEAFLQGARLNRKTIVRLAYRGLRQPSLLLHLLSIYGSEIIIGEI